jgi:alpha-tubulin suppressor-like RCC1 family protein
MPIFPGEQGFCSSAQEGAMIMYKNKLLICGSGSNYASNYVFGRATATATLSPYTTIPGNIANVWYQTVNAMALTTTGQVYCWGFQVNSVYPVRMNLPGPAIQIAGGLQKNNLSFVTQDGIFAAILGNGQLYMWGENSAGSLGRGDRTNSNTPAVPNGLASANVIKVTISSAYYGSVAALLSNGQLYTWGCNREGELGLGSKNNEISTPTLVSGFNNIIDVIFTSGVSNNEFNATSSRILCSNGASFAAGANYFDGRLAVGSLDNGVTTYRRETSNRSNIAAIRSLSNGYHGADLIIQNDGQMFFSGWKALVGIPSSANSTQATTSFQNGGGFGTLGFQRNMLANVGTPITTPIIRKIYGPDNRDNYGAAIIDNTGNIYGTGYNVSGNFGIGTTTNITTSWQQLNQYLPENKRAKDVLFSGYSTVGGTIVLMQDGTIAVAGQNTRGWLPYETNATGQTTAMPYWRYAVGFGPLDKVN